MRGPGTTCSKCGDREVWARGLCNRCYGHERQTGNLPKVHGKEKPRILVGDTDEKACRSCGVVKKGTEFWADRRARDGKQTLCKPCSTEYAAAWKRANPEGRLAIQRRRKEANKWETIKCKYGLSREEWEALAEAQNGRCALCRKKPGKRGLVIDHDHDSGKIRGLLCSGCNTGLGLMGDSAEGLRRALAYLNRSNPMAGQDITKVSRDPGARILKQGHTTNGDFGSNPNAKVKGGRTVRDLTIPTARG